MSKQCKPGFVINPETKRCIKIRGPTWGKLTPEQQKKALLDEKRGTERYKNTPRGLRQKQNYLIYLMNLYLYILRI